MPTDGFHLNARRGNVVAQIITEAIKMRMPLKTTSANNNRTTEINYSPDNYEQLERNEHMEEDTQYLVVDSEAVEHIIGKKGKRITEIKQRHKVRIATGETRADKEIVLTIEGSRNNRVNAIKEINPIICEQNDKRKKIAEAKSNKENIPCPYFQLGVCKYGEQCFYKHVQPAKTNPRTRSQL
jgi:predicted PilT family ATPase